MTMIGLPQGCSLSPILFCLFVADLPDFLLHTGVLLGEITLKYIMFADDLALLAETPADLQIAINSLASYCNENGFKINTEKTKILIFHKGWLPKCQFMLNSAELEIVNEFKYLGFTFSSQLSFTSHLESLNSKAASKCGYLLSNLKSFNISTQVILDLFACYVLPTYRYGLALWLRKCSGSSIAAMNAVFTKYLKRYMSLPYHANNAILYHLTSTQPLDRTLESLLPSSFSSLKFPEALNGLQLTMNNNTYPTEVYNPIPLVPSYFWHSKTYVAIPTYAHSRKALCKALFNFIHYDICNIDEFHASATPDCRCRSCGDVATQYHQYLCEDMTPQSSL